MAEPFASISMIVLDEEQFLGDAIESVLAQEYPQWELLLVDDGSTDESEEIARAYAAADSRIRLLQHPGRANRGMAESRGLALAHARGQVMSFLDGDDVWFRDTLSRQVALLERFPNAAMITASTMWWSSWDGSDGDCCDTVVSRAPRRDAPIDPPAFAAALIRDGGAAPCNCSTVVRVDDLRALGGFDAAFRDLYEDQMLYAKFGLERKVVVASDCLSKYRQHPEQCCVRAAEAGVLGAARRTFLEWVAAWVAVRGIRETGLEYELHGALEEVAPQPA